MTNYCVSFSWKVLSTIIFLIICYQLWNLSKRDILQRFSSSRALNSIVELHVCYLINIKNDRLSADHHFESDDGIDRDDDDERNDFSCNLSKPLSLFGKRFQNRTVSFIIQQFKRCRLEQLITFQDAIVGQLTTLDKLELHSDHICITYRIRIEQVNIQFIELSPTADNNQTFVVLLSFVRTFENEGRFRSIKKTIFKRTCRTSPDHRNYVCSEHGRKLGFGLVYTTIESIGPPYELNCVERPGDRLQKNCYEDCVKRSNKHISLSYTEDDDFELNFDDLDSMKPIIDQCTKQCSRPDCRSGNFFLTELDEFPQTNHSRGSFQIRIENADEMSKAVPFYPKIKIFWLLFTFFGLIFKINLCNQLCKLKNVYNYFSTTNRKNEKKLVSLLVVGSVGFLAAVVFDKLVFDFGIEHGLKKHSIESIKERSVSVSICFHLCHILKADSPIAKDDCRTDVLLNMSLGEIERLVWDEYDFKRLVTMRNSVRIVYLKENDTRVHVFYRNSMKCFLVFYAALNHYPHIALQRKSQIHFNITSEFQFFLEDGFSYPKQTSQLVNRSYLHRIKPKRLPEPYCLLDYRKQAACLSQDDCIQNCIVENYATMTDALPGKVNVKIDEFSRYLKFKFTNNRTAIEKANETCRSKFNRGDCEKVDLLFRSKYNVPERHNLSINLTPFIDVSIPLKSQNWLIVLNRILSLMIVLTGFSVKHLVKRSLRTVRRRRRISFLKYQYLKRSFNLIILLAFAVHFRCLLAELIYTEMENFTFTFYSEKVKVPVLRLCYELEQNLGTDNYTLSQLESLTLKKEEIFEKFLILDTEYRLNGTRSPILIHSFYLDNLKCYNLAVEERVGRVNKNYYTLDESLKLFVNLDKIPRRRYFLYINDKGVFDFDWHHLFYSNYYLLHLAKKQYVYQDDYWYIKNFVRFLRHQFGIEHMKNTQRLYSNHLKWLFYKQQRATTTAVPLYPHEDGLDAPIKNLQFQNFIHFRSLAGNENEYDFTVNSERYDFITDCYADRSYELGNRSIISFVPNFTYFSSITINKYHVLEFSLHMFVVFAFWFKVSFIRLPYTLSKSIPIIKFFIVVCVYCLVAVLVITLRLLFKFVDCLHFKNT